MIGEKRLGDVERVGWSSVGKRVMEAAEDYLENCANMKVDIEVLERSRDLSGTSRSTRREEAAIFSSSSTHQRNRTTSWQTEKDGLRVRGKTVHSKRVGKNEWHDMRTKE